MAAPPSSNANLGPGLATSADADQPPHFGARIYLPSTQPPLDLTAVSARIQRYFDSLLSAPLPHGPAGYIWTREPLTLRPSKGWSNASSSTSGQPPHLQVYMRTARSVDDEWLAVHLLRLASGDTQLLGDILAGVTVTSQSGTTQVVAAAAATSTSSPPPSLSIRVWDEDGELLLIEGADALPSWLDPENASGRVWLHSGQLHLIGPDVKGSSSNPLEGNLGPVSDVEALRILRTRPSEQTTAPSALSDLIFQNRIPSYPSLSWAIETQHTTLAYLPLNAAKVLKANPQLVSLVTDALESREGPEDARVLRSMTYFGPNSPVSLPGPSSTSAPSSSSSSSDPQPTLLTPVRLTRQLYATLLSLRVFPPKIFGQEWRRASEVWWTQGLPHLLGLPLSDSSNDAETKGEEDVPKSQQQRQAMLDDARRRDVGSKLIMGLELLYANARERRGRSKLRSRGGGASTSLHPDPSSKEEAQESKRELEAFRKALKGMGYFEGQLEGSAKWKELENGAVESWRKLRAVDREGREEDEHVTDDVADVIEASVATGLQVDGDEKLMGSSDASGASPISIDATRPSAELSSYEDPDTFVYEALASAARQEAASALPSNQQGQESGGSGDPEEEAAMRELGAFGEKLEAFLKGKGDVQGALFEDEGMDEDEDGDEEESEEEEDAAGERLGDVRERVQAMSAEERSRALLERLPGLIEPRLGQARAVGEQSDSADPTPSNGAVEVEMEDESYGNQQRSTNPPPPPAPTMLPGMKRGLDFPSPPAWSSTTSPSTTNIVGPTSDVPPHTIEASRQAVQSAKALLSTNRVRYDGASDDEESLDEEEARGMESFEERRERARGLGMEKEFEEDERGWREREMEKEREREKEEEASSKMEKGMAGVAVPVSLEGEEPTQEEVDVETRGFLEFARKALGLSEEDLEGIMRERRRRGAYVPRAYGAEQEDSKFRSKAKDQKGKEKADDSNQAKEQPSRKPFGPVPPPNLINVDENGEKNKTTEKEKEKEKEKTTPSFLSTFDEAMDSMEVELERRKGGGTGGVPRSTPSSTPGETKGKRKGYQAAVEEAMDEDHQGQDQEGEEDADEDDHDEAMDDAEEQELLRAMRENGGWPGLEEKLMGRSGAGSGAGAGAGGKEMPGQGVEEEMMRALLESFKGQRGASGPTGNLAARLGVRLPREGEGGEEEKGKVGI